MGIVLALSAISFCNLDFTAITSDYSDAISLDTENLKLSAVSGKIHIDNNWSATESTYSWCTGSGTFSDPYVIEDLVIDGGGSGSCIWIQNSDVYFNIENCTLYNSGNNWDDTGIKLAIDVDNGQLIENIIHDNYIGIYLESSDNNTISGNIISNSTDNGLVIANSYNNTISGNTANHNRESGISLVGTDNNNVSGNIMLNNGGGIFLDNANYTRVLNNTVEHSSGEGIVIGGNNNWISNNYVDNNTWGMSFDGGYNNTAIANYVNNSSAIGIEVYHDNQTFLDNIITNNGNGIMITSSNNKISGNTISFNDVKGIALGPDSNNNIIFRNTFEGNLVDNAYDDGTNNQWDNGTIGNYWDNYTGKDADDDGIGDTPYVIPGSAGSQDNFPIWDDGAEFKIPGYNLYFLLGILPIVAIVLSKKIKKK